MKTTTFRSFLLAFCTTATFLTGAGCRAGDTLRSLLLRAGRSASGASIRRG